jgi:hypothetical protein
MDVKKAPRDLTLARAVLALWDAAENAQTLIDEAERNGWGTDDMGAEWHPDYPRGICAAITKALAGVRQALKDGDYWDGDDLRKK